MWMASGPTSPLCASHGSARMRQYLRIATKTLALRGGVAEATPLWEMHAPTRSHQNRKGPLNLPCGPPARPHLRGWSHRWLACPVPSGPGWPLELWASTASADGHSEAGVGGDMIGREKAPYVGRSRDSTSCQVSLLKKQNWGCGLLTGAPVRGMRRTGL